MSKNSVLKNKKIIVEPNVKPTSFIPDVGHRSSFLAPGAKNRFVTPIDKKTGQYKEVLTEEERKYLEEEVYKRSLSVRERHDNFWDTFEVLLDKTPRTLDLRNPEDLITFKVLKNNTLTVAPSKKELGNKLSYRYYLRDVEEEALHEKEETDYEEKVWELFSDLKKDRVQMINFLKITGKSISSSTSDSFLIKQIKDTYIKGSKANMKYFYETLTDATFDIKVLVTKALNQQIIVKEGNKYYLKEGDKLGDTYGQLIKFLMDNKNQSIRVLIEDRVDI